MKAYEKRNCNVNALSDTLQRCNWGEKRCDVLVIYTLNIKLKDYEESDGQKRGTFVEMQTGNKMLFLVAVND
ncbi:MAG: hypothetical protein V3S97_03635 [Candidatus Bathyarchaeia archaeon]